jgi:pyridoxine 5-phosphate synthase
MTERVRLGINVDHVATLRNARGGAHPDPVRAAMAALAAGADGITAHLREDRRHIRDEDIDRLKAEVEAPLNLEMAATPEMLAIALRVAPHAACLVPERREERTTEGGLDVLTHKATIAPVVRELVDAGIRVSLFVQPDIATLEETAMLGAPVVELNTGSWSEAEGTAEAVLAFEKLVEAARHAKTLGLEVHAGHGLDYARAEAIAALPEVAELNIGHYLVGEAVFSGLDAVIRSMRAAMDRGRSKVAKPQ